MEKSSLRPYKDEINPPASKRIFAHLIDALFSMVLSFLLLLCSRLILQNASFYKEKEALVTQEMVRCYEIEEEAKIYYFKDNENHLYQNPIDQEEIFNDYAKMHLAYSFSKNPQEFEKNGITAKDFVGVSQASYENDGLAYFYATYVENYNQENDLVDLNGKTGKQYYYEVLKKYTYNPTDGSSLWVYDETDYSLPYLQASSAVDLFRYYENDDYQAGKSVRNLLAASYQKIWNEEVDHLVNSKRFKEHYDIYKENYATCSYLLDIFTIVSYLLSFFLIYVLPTLLMKHGKTLGKKFMKIRLGDKDGYEMTKMQSICRSLISFFLFFCSMIIPCFFSGGLKSGWMYPLFQIGTAGISLFTFMAISFLFALLSFILVFATKDKRSLQDLFCHTKAYDESYMKVETEKPVDNDESGKDEMKKPEEKTYLDSSTFSNPERADLTKKD